MKLLALDIATKTGWALSLGKDRVYSGVQDFSLKRGESPGMRFLRFDRWIYQILAENTPELVIYEMPHHRGGAATAVLGGLLGILLKACAETRTEHTSVHSGALKRFATGKGNASKSLMLETAKKRFGGNITDDNQADALWLFDYGKREYDRHR